MNLDSDFYSTTAQVIPAIILALVVEQRFLEREVDQSAAASLAWVTFIMGALVLGESAALAGAAGHGNVWLARMVVAAMGLGGFHLVGYFLFDRMGRELGAIRPKGSGNALLLGCLVPVVVMVNLLFAVAPLLIAIYVIARL